MSLSSLRSGAERAEWPAAGLGVLGAGRGGPKAQKQKTQHNQLTGENVASLSPPINRSQAASGSSGALASMTDWIVIGLRLAHRNAMIECDGQCIIRYTSVCADGEEKGQRTDHTTQTAHTTQPTKRHPPTQPDAEPNVTHHHARYRHRVGRQDGLPLLCTRPGRFLRPRRHNSSRCCAAWHCSSHSSHSSHSISHEHDISSLLRIHLPSRVPDTIPSLGPCPPGFGGATLLAMTTGLMSSPPAKGEMR